jgi:hypothetical protein
LLRYAGSSIIPFYLPEGIAYPDAQNPDGYRACLREVKEKGLERRYPKEKRQGLLGFPRNNGNLVHMTYFLYLADVIAGVCHDNHELRIRPRIPGWSQLELRSYPTRFGPVSYQYNQNGSLTKLTICKPAVKACLELPWSKGRVMMNDKHLIPKKRNELGVETLSIRLPATAEIVRIEIRNGA